MTIERKRIAVLGAGQIGAIIAGLGAGRAKYVNVVSEKI